MKNYICMNGVKIELPEDKIKEIYASLKPQKRLCEKKVGEDCGIGSYQFIVLEQSGDTTALILKDLLEDGVAFGSSNNDYRNSNVRKICKNFAKELESLVGSDNLVEHKVDLTSVDGLKDYGYVREKASLLTADLYRRYVEVLDIERLEKWWWLATPHSTKRHENESWVFCVSPRGSVSNINYSHGNIGVRPFCILKSNIFVS